MPHKSPSVPRLGLGSASRSFSHLETALAFPRASAPHGNRSDSATPLCHPRCCLWQWEPDCGALPSNPWLTAVTMSRLAWATCRICQAELTASPALTACCCLGARRGGQPWRQGWRFGQVWAGFCSPGTTIVPCKPHWNCHGRLQEPRGAFSCCSQGPSSSDTAQPKQ